MTIAPVSPSSSPVVSAASGDHPPAPPGGVAKWDVAYIAARVAPPPAAGASAGAARQSEPVEPRLPNRPVPSRQRTGTEAERPAIPRGEVGAELLSAQSPGADVTVPAALSATDPGAAVGGDLAAPGDAPGSGASPGAQQARPGAAKAGAKVPGVGSQRGVGRPPDKDASGSDAQQRGELGSNAAVSVARGTGGGASSELDTGSPASGPVEPGSRGTLPPQKAEGHGLRSQHPTSGVLATPAQCGAGVFHPFYLQGGGVAAAPSGTGSLKSAGEQGVVAVAASAVSGGGSPSVPSVSAAHSTAGSPDPDPPAQPLLNQTTANLTNDGGGTARILLHPPTLGPVEVRVTLAPSGAASIHISAATPQGFAALTAANAGLMQHLEQRGVTVGSLQTQLQGDARQGGAPGGGGGRSQQRSTPAGAWAKRDTDETVIAYA